MKTVDVSFRSWSFIHLILYKLCNQSCHFRACLGPAPQCCGISSQSNCPSWSFDGAIILLMTLVDCHCWKLVSCFVHNKCFSTELCMNVWMVHRHIRHVTDMDRQPLGIVGVVLHKHPWYDLCQGVYIQVNVSFPKWSNIHKKHDLQWQNFEPVIKVNTSLRLLCAPFVEAGSVICFCFWTLFSVCLVDQAMQSSCRHLVSMACFRHMACWNERVCYAWACTVGLGQRTCPSAVF